MKIALAIVGALVAMASGCGGGSPSDAERPQSTAEHGTDVDPSVQAGLKSVGDKLAATLHRLADVADAADCGRASQIRELRARMRTEAKLMQEYAAEPAFRNDVAGAQRSVDEIDDEVTDVLRDCRDRRELETAADEAHRLADEIEQEAREP